HVISIGYMTYSALFLFFFSSRRRHTRSKRDWSSDVCSSDLYLPADNIFFLITQPGRIKFKPKGAPLCNPAFSFIARPVCCRNMRSEERRVGKESRYKNARAYGKMGE